MLVLSVTAAAPESTVNPPVPRVSVFAPPIVTAFVLVGVVPRMVRLLMEKSAPSVVLKFDVFAFEAANRTSVVEPGAAFVSVVPAELVAQLVLPALFVPQLVF